MQTKLIAFDMDGTLLDSMEELEELAVDILLLSGVISNKEAAHELYQSCVGMPFRNQLDCIVPDSVADDARLDRVGDLYEKYHSIKASSFVLSPGVNKAFIESLHVPTVLVSSTKRSLILEHIKVVQEIGLRYIGGYSVGSNKRQQLLGCMVAYDVKPSEALFVGDTFRDKEYAEELGMQYINVNPGNVVQRTTYYNLFGHNVIITGKT